MDFRAGGAEELTRLAEQVVALRPDAIVAVSSLATAAARGATRTIPIILHGPDDVVALGYAASYARPGGNLTGVTIMGAGLDAKRLHVLREAVPAARRIAALVHPAFPSREGSLRGQRAVAAEAGFELIEAQASGPGDYASAFTAMRAAGVEAVAITANAGYFNDAAMLIALAAEARLPTICEWRVMAEAGCVLSYGPDRAAPYRRIGDYAARILRGANPGDLPIEQPTAFELVINARAAKALGLDIPPSLLARADEVIE